MPVPGVLSVPEVVAVFAIRPLAVFVMFNAIDLQVLAHTRRYISRSERRAPPCRRYGLALCCHVEQRSSVRRAIDRSVEKFRPVMTQTPIMIMAGGVFPPPMMIQAPIGVHPIGAAHLNAASTSFTSWTLSLFTRNGRTLRPSSLRDGWKLGRHERSMESTRTDANQHLVRAGPAVKFDQHASLL
jgi:hypothetical protein